MKKLVLLLCGVVVLGMAAQPASAKPALYLGYSLDPDDFLVGFRWNNPMSNENLWLVPSIEAGFGDVTMIDGSIDLHYHFKGKTKFYAGGGGTLTWYDWEGDSDTEFGASLLGGIMLNTSSGKLPFFETKFGLGDVPDIKFILGLNF